MKYCTVADIAKKWNISERSVRDYCSKGRVEGAHLDGKTWKIPDTAQKPQRANAQAKKSEKLSDILKNEKKCGVKGGIYHKIQIDLTYNSNHIEGSKLTQEQTRYIYETNTIGVESNINMDDILETVNHFRCIDYMIDKLDYTLTEKLIKQLHYILKSGTSDSRRDWFAVGEYKRLPNEVGGKETALPEDVPGAVNNLLKNYNKSKEKNLEEILDFHFQFESIHPFQDGNGRVGRLIMFKECLRNNIVPFIIDDDLKLYYYRGLREWKNERGYLKGTCLTAQDRFKVYLDYFRIHYE